MYIGTDNSYYTSNDEKTFVKTTNTGLTNVRCLDINKIFWQTNIAGGTNAIYYNQYNAQNSFSISNPGFYVNSKNQEMLYAHGYLLMPIRSSGTGNGGIYYKYGTDNSATQVSNTYFSRDGGVKKFCLFNNKIYFITPFIDYSGLYVTSHIAHRTTTKITGTPFDTTVIDDICVYNGSLYVAAQKKVYYSPDGINFTDVGLTLQNDLILFVYMGRLYVSNQNYYYRFGVYVSSDGVAFTQIPNSQLSQDFGVMSAKIYKGKLYLSYYNRDNGDIYKLYTVDYQSSVSPFVKSLNEKFIDKKVAISDLKSVVAASSDFADFQSRIASL